MLFCDKTRVQLFDFLNSQTHRL